MWTKCFGGSGFAIANAAAVDSADNLVIGGAFLVRLDPHLHGTTECAEDVAAEVGAGDLDGGVAVRVAGVGTGVRDDEEIAGAIGDDQFCFTAGGVDVAP